MRCAHETLRGSAHPPPFLQSADGYSEKWLRILLRATPRDPQNRRRQWQDLNDRRRHHGGSSSGLRSRESHNQNRGQESRPGHERVHAKDSLNKRIVSKMDQKVLGELARLGGLQKYLLMQIKGLPDEEGLRRELNSTLSVFITSEVLNTIRSVDMIVKVQPSRKHSSSFKRLHEYLHKSVTPTLGTCFARRCGPVVESSRLRHGSRRNGKELLLSMIVARMQSAILNWHGLQESVLPDHNGQTQHYKHESARI